MLRSRYTLRSSPASLFAYQLSEVYGVPVNHLQHVPAQNRNLAPLQAPQCLKNTLARESYSRNANLSQRTPFFFSSLRYGSGISIKRPPRASIMFSPTSASFAQPPRS